MTHLEETPLKHRMTSKQRSSVASQMDSACTQMTAGPQVTRMQQGRQLMHWMIHHLAMQEEAPTGHQITHLQTAAGHRTTPILTPVTAHRMTHRHPTVEDQTAAVTAAQTDRSKNQPVASYNLGPT